MEVLQPKLRFPEFEGNWDKNKLKEVTSYVDYRGRAPIKTNNGIFLVTAKNIKKGYIDYNSSKEYVSESDYLNVMSKGLPEIGDVLFTTEAPMGNVAQVNIKNIALAQRVIKFRGNENISNLYLLHFMLSDVFQSIVSEKSIGTTVQGISGKELHNIKISFPSLPEQTKIANFLSEIDEKINLLKENKSLLEEYKKGIMQKIFNQKIRFKDDNGNDFEDWEEKTIIDICTKIQSGGTPKSTTKDYYNGTIPFLSIADMTKQGKYIEFTSNSISDYGLQNSSSWIVPVNSIIYSMYASVGFVAINRIPIATSQAVLNLILKDNICIDYVYYFLLDFQKYLAEYITTGTQGNLNAQTVKGFVIPIPSLEEQTKIANFLSSIDKKMELVNTQIQDTQEYKKGLLQQMFI
jgi:type I restriction enzyme S subunit